MRSICTRIAAAALLAAPAVARGQVPGPPVYLGAVTTLTAHGCGNAPNAYPAPPIMNALCLDGFISVGRIALAPGNPSSTTAVYYYNFAVSQSPAFTPTDLLFNDDGGYFSGYQSSLYFDAGHLIGAHSEPVNVDFATPIPFFSDPHVFEFVFRSPTAPPEGGFWPGFDVRLTTAPTTTPEPATLALTLGGLAMLGAAAWRRRRA